MKKWLCAVIFLLGFAGCSATQFKEPPKMHLDYTAGGKAVRETVGYASAAWGNSEMDAGPADPNIQKTEDLKEITIRFEAAPDSFEEIRVNGGTILNESLAAAEYVLALPTREGKYVYMVRANWPQGRADYFFTVLVE